MKRHRSNPVRRLTTLFLGILPLTAFPAAPADELAMDPSAQQLQVATKANHTYTLYRSEDSLTAWEEFTAMEGNGEMMAVDAHAADPMHDAVFYSMAKRNHFAKKGFGGIGGADLRADSLQPLVDAMQAMNVSWYYNWGLRPDPRMTLPDDIEFVPMYWGAREEWPIPQEDLDWVRDNPKITHLLGFNEPAHIGQAEMTVEEAIAAWPYLMATGKRLGSPAVANMGRAISANSWLGRFMAQIEARDDLRVDFIAIHLYQKSPNVQWLIRECERLYERYGRPVWITEWSLVDWTSSNPANWTSPDENAQAAYLKAAIEAMEAVPFIERHAWFAIKDSSELAGGNWDMGLVEREEVYAGRDPETGRRLYNLEVELTVVGEAMRDADTSPPGSE